MKKKILFITDWPDSIDNSDIIQKLLDNSFSDNYKWTIWSCKKQTKNTVSYRWKCYFKGAFYAIKYRKQYDAIFIEQQMIGYILSEVRRIIRFTFPKLIVFTYIYNSDSIFKNYKKRMVKHALQCCHALIWPSSEMSSEVKKDFPKYAGKNFHTPTPVFDIIDTSCKVEEALDDPRFRNGIFSAGKSERDFNIVIRAFKNTAAPVTIVCPDEYPITETEISSNIRILRFSAVSHEQYYALAGQAFCILISLINEKSACGGLIINFAMLNSKPIIATDSASVRDFIENNVNGLIFPVGESKEIYNAYQKLINDKSFAESVAKNAKEIAIQTSPEYFIPKLISIIENN